MPSNNEIRQSVCEVLELLSSKELQIQFQLKSPSANVAMELLCLWFSELYQPGSQLFNRSFNSDEQAMLQQFNRYYDLRKANLPETIEQLHGDSEWQIVRDQAKILLIKFRNNN